MKKIIFSILGVCSFFICLCFLFFTNAIFVENNGTDIDNAKTVSAAKENMSVDEEISGDTARLVLSTSIYSKTDKIWFNFKAESTSSIVSYTIESEGFKVLSHYRNGQDINVKVKLNEDNEYPFVKVKIYLENGNCPEPEAYGYVEDEMISINKYSHIDAKGNLNNYLYENDLINAQEYEARKIALNKMCSQEEITYSKKSGISLFANYAQISGTVTWKDDSSVSHPLQYALVELYDYTSDGAVIKSFTYTSVSGYYSFAHTLADGQVINPFIKIYPAGINVKVVEVDGTEYVWQSSVAESLTNGSYVNINVTFDMNCSLGRAFQVSQPAILGARFVYEMNGSYIPKVTVCYPNESSFTSYYVNTTKTIYIDNEPRLNESLPQAYAEWDTILHEFGHHVSHEFDIIKSLGGLHYEGVDMADHYMSHLSGDNTNSLCKCPKFNTVEQCKYYGNSIAWSEGWATFFGTMVQQYYSESLSNINTVGDTLSTSSSGVEYSLENPYVINGESDELTVQAALWDMFDLENEAHDTLSLGYDTMWAMSVNSKATTYAEFMDYFNANINNISYRSAAGKINAYHKMAPNNVSVSDGSASTVSPLITWDNMEFVSKYYNKPIYKVYILNSAGNILLTTVTLDMGELSYEFPQYWWNNINKYYIAVYGGDECSSSGKYWSELINLEDLNYNIIHDNSTRVIERNITLAAGEYIDYYITFDGSTSYDRVFTTFGSKDTTLTLYDENGNQIKYDDDSGYSLNALIHLVQQNGKTYRLRVKFYSSTASGTFRLVIFRAWRMNGKEPDKFEKFFSISVPTSIVQTLSVGEDSSWIITPSSSGNYTIETETRITDIQDMFIYLFNPYTGEIFYDDNSAGNLQARINVYLEAGQQYFLIITRCDPGATVTGESIINMKLD